MSMGPSREGCPGTQTSVRQSKHITWLCARSGSLLGDWQDRLGEAKGKERGKGTLGVALWAVDGWDNLWAF